MSNPWEATELFGKMLGEYTDNGYRMGTLDERERIIAMAEAKVCFGHQETGNCEHSVCFGMRDLIRKIGDSE